MKEGTRRALDFLLLLLDYYYYFLISSLGAWRSHNSWGWRLRVWGCWGALHTNAVLFTFCVEIPCGCPTSLWDSRSVPACLQFGAAVASVNSFSYPLALTLTCRSRLPDSRPYISQFWTPCLTLLYPRVETRDHQGRLTVYFLSSRN